MCTVGSDAEPHFPIAQPAQNAVVKKILAHGEHMFVTCSACAPPNVYFYCSQMTAVTALLYYHAAD